MISRFNFAKRCFSVNLASVTRAQVVESKDAKFIGDYVKAVTLAPAQQQQEHVQHIDEYFR